MAIQDLPQFSKLSPEAQKIVLDKYNGLSAEAKQIVDSKIGSPVNAAGMPIQGERASNIQEGLIEEIPGVSPALVHGTVPLAEAVGETTQIPEAIRNPLSGTIGILPEIAGALSAPKIAKAVAPMASKALKPLARATDIVTAPSVNTSNAKLGEALAEKGLARGSELIGEPRTRNAILEYKESLKPLASDPANIVKAYEPQGIINEYDKIGHILEHLKVAKKGATPKQLVSSKTIQELSATKEAFSTALKSLSENIYNRMGDVANAYKRANLIKTAGKITGYGVGGGALAYALKKLGGGQ